MPRALVPIAALLVALVPAADAAAKAAYVDLPTALEQAEIVALVQVESVTADDIAGEHWTYRQRVVAHPIEVLKGELPATFTIAGNRSFICAPVPYEAPATYVLLLAHDGEPLATVNNDDGQAQVFGDRIDWPYDEVYGDTVPLAPVLDDLRARLGTRAVVDAPTVPVVEVPADAPASRPESTPASVLAPEWIVPVSMLGGALAVVLGFGVALRRRPRR